MAHNCFLRSLITIFHAGAGVISGFFIVFTLYGWGDDIKCLPPIMDGSNEDIQLTGNLRSLCKGTVFTMAGTVFLSFTMAFVINCLWRYSFVVFTHLFLSLIMMCFSVFSASLFTFHYLLWCGALLHKSDYDMGCKEAASAFDNRHKAHNMTTYYHRLNAQQASTWSVVPVLVVISILYGISMRVSAGWSAEQNQGQFRYVVVNEETTPLINPVTQATPTARARSGTFQSHNSNPFDQ